jgi:CheY-like chemotaxis protein
LNDRRALVAEDTLLVLIALEMILEQHGIQVVGPASTVGEALALAETAAADIAILDVNLHGEMIFPVADCLIGRGIPVIFTTGYTLKDSLPPHLQTVPTIRKPYKAKDLMELVGQAFGLSDMKLEECP